MSSFENRAARRRLLDRAFSAALSAAEKATTPVQKASAAAAALVHLNRKDQLRVAKAIRQHLALIRQESFLALAPSNGGVVAVNDSKEAAHKALLAKEAAEAAYAAIAKEEGIKAARKARREAFLKSLQLVWDRRVSKTSWKARLSLTLCLNKAEEMVLNGMSVEKAIMWVKAHKEWVGVLLAQVVGL